MQEKGRKRYSEDETKALFKAFVSKTDTSMAPKIKTAKRWLKRIAGIFLALIGLPFLLSGVDMAGLIIMGFSAFFLVGGFMSPSMGKMAGVFLFPAVGIVIAVLSYSAYQTSLESNAWPTVDGSIIRSDIERQTTASGEGDHKKTQETLIPKIAYQYPVDGQRYESTIISFSSSTIGAKQLVSRYPVGKRVSVYYNPDKPKQAVLVPGGSGFNYVPYFFSAFFILLGLVMLGRWRKQARALGNRF